MLALDQLARARAVKIGLGLDRQDPEAEMQAELLHDQALPPAHRLGPRAVDVIFPTPKPETP